MIIFPFRCAAQRCGVGTAYTIGITSRILLQPGQHLPVVSGTGSGISCMNMTGNTFRDHINFAKFFCVGYITLLPSDAPWHLNSISNRDDYRLNPINIY